MEEGREEQEERGHGGGKGGTRREEGRREGGREVERDTPGLLVLSQLGRVRLRFCLVSLCPFAVASGKKFTTCRYKPSIHRNFLTTQFKLNVAACTVIHSRCI